MSISGTGNASSLPSSAISNSSRAIVSKIWKVIVGAEQFAHSLFPQLKDARYPDLPEKLEFFHAEEILQMYPDLPRKQRETEILQKHPAIFIIGIGWTLERRLSARNACSRL